VQRLVVLAATAVGLAACSDTHSATAPDSPSRLSADRLGGSVGAVYTSTNGPAGNAVVAYARSNDGRLTRIGSFNTGGLGMGTGTDPLGSQFSVILSQDHAHLYVVNAGSHNITVFDVQRGGGLVWRQTIDSRGGVPVSLAIRGSRLYVLNQGDNAVGGFRVGDDGLLTSLPGGWQKLPAGAAGASTVRVGDHTLLVTERTTNRIDIFPLDNDGRIGAPDTAASNGATPFGFDIGQRGLVLVSEAGPNAVSSYRLHDDHLNVRDGSVPTDGMATCWVRLSPDERFAFSANAGSATVTAFAVDHNGTIARVQIGALATGAGPLDLDVTPDSRFVYAVEAGASGIGGFEIGLDGKLTSLPGATGVGGLEGLAAF
jgi:6-phosphogluconolactonase